VGAEPAAIVRCCPKLRFTPHSAGTALESDGCVLAAVAEAVHRALAADAASPSPVTS